MRFTLLEKFLSREGAKKDKGRAMQKILHNYHIDAKDVAQLRVNGTSAARKAKSHVRSALAFSMRWNGTPSRGHAFWWTRPLTAETSRDHSGGNGKHPHAETSRDHSGGNGKQPVIAHLSSPVH